MSDEDFLPISSVHGSFIGKLRPDGTLVMVRDEAEHLYRKLNGICMSTDILHRLASGKIAFVRLRQQCVKIQMTLKRKSGEDELYFTTPQFWIDNGEVVDYGEVQTCLPLVKWDRVGVQEPEEFVDDSLSYSEFLDSLGIVRY